MALSLAGTAMPVNALAADVQDQSQQGGASDLTGSNTDADGQTDGDTSNTEKSDDNSKDAGQTDGSSQDGSDNNSQTKDENSSLTDDTTLAEVKEKINTLIAALPKAEELDANDTEQMQKLSDQLTEIYDLAEQYDIDLSDNETLKAIEEKLQTADPAVATTIQGNAGVSATGVSTYTGYAQLGEGTTLATEGTFSFENSVVGGITSGITYYSMGANGVLTQIDKPKSLTKGTPVVVKIPGAFTHNKANYDVYVKIVADSDVTTSWVVSTKGGDNPYITIDPNSGGEDSFTYEVWLQNGDTVVTSETLHLVAGSCYTADNGTEGTRPYGTTGSKIYTNHSKIAWVADNNYWKTVVSTSTSEDSPSKYVIGHGMSSANSIMGGYVSGENSGNCEIVLGYLTTSVTYSYTDDNGATKTETTEKAKIDETLPTPPKENTNWTADIDVTTKDGTTYEKGETIPSDAMSNITTTEKVTFKESTKVSATVTANDNLTYSGSNLGLVSTTKDDGTTVQYRWKLKDADDSAYSDWSVTIPNGLDAGTYTVQYKVTADKGYTLTDATKTDDTLEVTIAPKDVTVKITPAGKTYDGSATTTVDKIDDVTGVNNETISVAKNSVAVSFEDTTGAVGKDKIVTADTSKAEVKVTGGQAKAENYNIEYVVEKADITEKTATATVTANNRTYDGTEKPLVTVTADTGAKVQYLVNNEWVDKVPTATDAGKTTVTYRVVGKDGNYTTDSKEQTVEVTIAPKDVTVKITPAGKIYDGSATTTVDKIDDVAGVNNETISVAKNSVAVSFKDTTGAVGKDKTVTADTSKAEVTVKGGREKASNYNITYEVEKANITAAEVSATVSKVENLTYDGNDHNLVSVNIPDASNGKVKIEYSTDGGNTWSETVPTGKDADKYTVKYKITSTDPNYEVTGTSEGSLDVTIAKKKVEAQVTAKEKDYDGTGSATISSVTVSKDQLAENDSIEIADVTGSFEDVNAGIGKKVTVDSKKASISGTNAKNYEVKIPTETTANINKKAVTATVTPASKDYDGKKDATVESITTPTGVNDETITVDPTSVTVSFQDANVGVNKDVNLDSSKATYTVSGSNNVASNYQVSYEVGKADITQKTASAKVEANTPTYNGQPQELVKVTPDEGAKVQYKVGDDWVDDVPTETNAGTYTVTYRVVPKDGNYTTDAKEQTVYVTIAQKEINVTITANDKTWDGNNTATVKDIKIDGLVTTDGVTDDVSVDKASVNVSFQDEKGAVGNDKLVDVTSNDASLTGEDAANYKIKEVNKTTTASITKASQSSPNGKTSDTADPTKETVTPADETINGKNDGVITGVDDTMEYRKAGDTEWTTVPSGTTSIEDLEDGDYEVRYKETDTHNASPADTITVKQGKILNITVEPKSDAQIGYTLTTSTDTADASTDDKEQSWHGGYTITFNLNEGYSKLDNFAVKVNGETVDLTEDENGNEIFQVTNMKTDHKVTIEGVADITAPTGSIEINDDANSKWDKFTEDADFNLFYNDQKTVTIKAEDKGSGVNTISYYVSDKALTEDEVKALTDTDWTESNTLTLDPDQTAIVYAKLTDKAGNVSYISSDGMEFDGTAPVLEGLEDGKEYCIEASFNPTDKNIDKVYVDGQETSNFTIQGDDAEHTVKVTDKAGNSTEYKITVHSKHAFGEYKEVSRTDTQVIEEATCERCGKTIQKVRNISTKYDDVVEEEDPSGGRYCTQTETTGLINPEIGGFSTDAARNYLTEEDKAQIADGKNVIFYLTIEKIEESSVKAENLTAMTAKAASIKDAYGSLQKGMFLNLSLWKQADDEEAELVENAKLGSPVTVSYTLPDELKAKDGKSRNYYVLQTYEGETYVLDAECDGDTITFSTDKCSDVSIWYTENGKTTLASTGKSASLNKTSAKAAKTGDNQSVMFYSLFAAFAAALAAVAAFVKRKMKRDDEE